MIQFYLTNTGYTSEQIAAEEGLILDASSMTAVGFAKKGNTKLTVTLPFMRLAHSLENLDSSDAVALSQKGAKDMYVDLQSQISAAQSGVSSVGLSVPTGLEVSGSPITSSGTLSVTMADGYSIPLDASLDNFQRAYVALHTHENKTILDSITDSSFHTHSNKSILDGITSTDINNFVDASNAKHSHTNYDILSGLTDTSISNWNTAYTNNHTHTNSGILDGLTDSSIAAFLQDTSYGAGTVQDITTGTDETVKVWSAKVINDYLSQYDANAVRYKNDFTAGTGDITGTGNTLTTVANKKGDLYIVSTAGTFLGVEMQVGDSIIFKKNVATNTAPVASDITFVQGTVKVVNQDASLQWGALTKIATVEGVDISVALPANPTAGYGNVVTKNYTDTISSSSGALVTDGAVKAYVDTALDQAHTHTNKDILDGVTDTSISNWNTAYTNNHTHANKDILDSIVDSSFHTHSNKSVLDGITSTDINNFIDASNARHTHANKGILDGLTDTSISNWNTAYSWGNHANGGYAQQSYVLDVSTRLDGAVTRIANVSTYAIDVSSYAADVSSRLSTTITRVGDVSSYSIDVSSRLTTLDNTLSTRIANVSTYAINVSTYAANTSTRLAVTDTNVSNVSTYAANTSTRLSTTNTNVANVSTYAANVSTYAANVSTNTNSRIANVSTYASNVSTNLYNLKNDVSVLEQIWAAAWNQLRALNPSLNVPSTPY